MDIQEATLTYISQRLRPQLKHRLAMEISEHYNIMPPRNVEDILNNCIANGLVSVDNKEQCRLTQKGRDWLYKKAQGEYTQTAYAITKETTKKQKKEPIDWNKWGVILAVISIIVSIIIALCS